MISELVMMLRVMNRPTSPAEVLLSKSSNSNDSILELNQDYWGRFRNFIFHLPVDKDLVA